VARFEYVDFRLKIGPRLDDNRYIVRAASDISGEASGIFCLPFSEIELENFVLKVGLTQHRRRGIGSLEWETARAFGQRLFEAVFTPEVRACFASSRTNVQLGDNVLRIRLTLDGAELFNYPWEFMYDSSLGRFLTLYEETPLIRYIELPMPMRPLAVTPPLHLLVMISNPNDYPRLDVERERSNLTKALSDLKAQGLVTVDWLDEANLELLSNQLLKQNYHIFHFIGHGVFDKRIQDGLLILKSTSGYGERVSGERLAVLLGNHRTLRLVVLNTCEGARTSTVDPFAGTATTLVRAGNLPVVVAMQFEISDTAAIAFAQGFYSALAAGRSVDAAVIQARLAIFAKGNDVE
jgi:CHAT domain-containing protein